MRDSSSDYYQRLWDTMVVLPDWTEALRFAVAGIRKHEDRYRKAADTDIHTIPWQFIAAIHYRECGANFRYQLLNGQSWNAKTTMVPQGLGPWESWEESTRFAIRRAKWNRQPDWSIPWLLRRLEQHNGGGYMKRGLNSPYLWSGSNHGVGVGKYVADGKYSAGAVDKQIGAALLVKELMR